MLKILKSNIHWIIATLVIAMNTATTTVVIIDMVDREKHNNEIPETDEPILKPYEFLVCTNTERDEYINPKLVVKYYFNEDSGKWYLGTINGGTYLCLSEPYLKTIWVKT